jgi:tetratricopeptide (TPR) repeat protein
MHHFRLYVNSLIPSSGNAYQRKAFALERQTQFAAAVAVYEASLKYATSDYQRAGLLLNLARAHNKLKHFTEAFRIVCEAIKLSPEFAPAIELKSITEEEIGDLQGALTTRTEFIKRFPRRFEGYFHRANLHQRLGNFNDAIQDFQNGNPLPTFNGCQHRVAGQPSLIWLCLFVTFFFC